MGNRFTWVFPYVVCYIYLYMHIRLDVIYGCINGIIHPHTFLNKSSSNPLTFNDEVVL